MRREVEGLRCDAGVPFRKDTQSRKREVSEIRNRIGRVE